MGHPIHPWQLKFFLRLKNKKSDLKFFTGIFLFIAIFCLSETGTCQSIQLGLKGGVSLPNLSSGTTISGVSSGYRSISGPDLAILSELKFNEKWSLQVAVEWSTQGGQTEGVQSISVKEFPEYLPPGSNVQTVYGGFVGVAKLRYVMLPVMAKYYIKIGNSGRWKFYVDAGIFGAYMMEAKGSATGSSKIYYDPAQTQPVNDQVITIDSTSDIKSKLHTGNFGVTGDLGFVYHLNKFSVFAEGGANYGFINLQKNPNAGASHTKAVVFRIGFMTTIHD
jgi:Outer membrane protein beta-barrel domain